MFLKQNGKMIKTMKETGKAVFNFGIPAFRSASGLMTCPNASNCVNGCYARSGTYRFKNTLNAYETRLTATQADNFVDLMNAEIKYYARVYNNLFIRIHDSGDFYSQEYAFKWFEIMRQNPAVKFYAYTKMISMFTDFKLLGIIPENFTVIYSFGGKEDYLIDRSTDRHAYVFSSSNELDAMGYANGTDNDMIAAEGKSNKIGLVYHGVKNYENTNWAMIG